MIRHTDDSGGSGCSRRARREDSAIGKERYVNVPFVSGVRYDAGYDEGLAVFHPFVVGGRSWSLMHPPHLLRLVPLISVSFRSFMESSGMKPPGLESLDSRCHDSRSWTPGCGIPSRKTLPSLLSASCYPHHGTLQRRSMLIISLIGNHILALSYLLLQTTVYHR